MAEGSPRKFPLELGKNPRSSVFTHQKTYQNKMTPSLQ